MFFAVLPRLPAHLIKSDFIMFFSGSLGLETLAGGPATCYSFRPNRTDVSSLLRRLMWPWSYLLVDCVLCRIKHTFSFGLFIRVSVFALLVILEKGAPSD